jgi:Ca2+-binding EF-hand superfamily protein
MYSSQTVCYVVTCYSEYTGEDTNGLKDFYQAQQKVFKKLNPTLLKRAMSAAKDFYDHQWTQYAISLVLIMNFALNIIETEVMADAKNALQALKGGRRSISTAADPRPLRPEEESAMRDVQAMQHLFDLFDAAFSIFYTVEVLINLFGHFWRPFFSSWWNIFDLVVVSFSLSEALYVDLSSGSTGDNKEDLSLHINVLRCVRVFRVLRICNKIKSLSRILISISASVAPVLSAFMLCFILISIYAIVGVNLFADRYPHADEYYSSFSKSFVSLLGIATGDSWAYEVRMMSDQEAEKEDTSVVLFFVTYVVMVGVVSIQIVVTVLLEAFLTSCRDEKEADRIALELEEHQKEAEPLDPLLATLANFKSSDHLKYQLDILFSLFDVDDNGSLSYDEMRTGIHKFGFKPDIHLSLQDWDDLTLNNTLCNTEGELTRLSFAHAMKLELQEYAQRLLANKMMQSVRSNSENSSLYFAFKLVKISQTSGPYLYVNSVKALHTIF